MNNPSAPELTEQQVAAQGRELEQAKWRLPARYELNADLLALPPDELQKRNPEMFAIWQRVQADEKRLAEMAASPFGQMSPQDAYRARAAQRAEEMAASIYAIDQQIGKALTAGEGSVEDLQAAKLALRHRRAEYLAALGRFDLAASVEPDPQYRDHYLAILDAVWLADDMRCDCPPTRGSGEFSDITVSNFNPKEEVFSIKEGRIVTLMACTKCGFLNAIDPPAQVKEQRAHRARAAKLVGTMKPEDAAKTLAARGLTSAKLLK